MDLLLGTQYLLGHSGYVVSLHLVNEHQDECPYNMVTCNKAMNIETSLIANQKLTLYQPGPSDFQILHGQ